MEQLMRSAQAGRIVHALLFVGPHGTGKKTMAEIMARAILCSSTGDKPCDACPACKKCLQNLHPDVHCVAPEKNTIKVDQIRSLISDLSLAAYEGGKKIAIIEHADAMNESAQNALLKTLENPTGDTLFFLLTDVPGALLPTIISRCLTVRFSCLEPEACAQVLISRGVEADKANILAAAAQGSVGRALEMHADAEYPALRARVIDAIEALEKPQDVLRMSAQLGEAKDKARQVLEIMELWARDLMRVQNGMPPLQKQEQARLAKSKHSGSGLLRCVMRARQQLSGNLSWIHVLESMDFELVSPKGV